MRSALRLPRVRLILSSSLLSFVAMSMHDAPADAECAWADRDHPGGLQPQDQRVHEGDEDASPAPAEEQAKNKGAKKRQTPFQCQEAFVVSGGKLVKPVAVDFHRFENEAYVKVGKREAWLCQAAAGKARGLDPLNRTRLVDALIAELPHARPVAQEREDAPAEPAQRPSMCSLGIDEDDGEFVMKKSRKKGGKPRGPPIEPVWVSVPMRQQGCDQQVRCLSRAPASNVRNAIYVHSEFVPWVVETLSNEVALGGVDFEPPSAKLREPWWSHRERAWKCRAKGLDGKTKRKSLAVPMVAIVSRGIKRQLNEREFRDAKAKKLQETQRWRDGVEQGFEDE